MFEHKKEKYKAVDETRARRMREEAAVRIGKTKRDQTSAKRRNAIAARAEADDMQAIFRTPGDLLSQIADLGRHMDVGDDELSETAVRTVVHILRLPEPPTDAVISQGIVESLVRFVSRSDNRGLQGMAVAALADVAAGDRHHTQKVITDGALPPLIAVIQDPGAPDFTVAEAVRCISNVAGESAECRDAVMQAGAVSPVLALARPGASLPVVQAVASTLCNIVRFDPLPDISLLEEHTTAAAEAAAEAAAAAAGDSVTGGAAGTAGGRFPGGGRTPLNSPSSSFRPLAAAGAFGVASGAAAAAGSPFGASAAAGAAPAAAAVAPLDEKPVVSPHSFLGVLVRLAYSEDEEVLLDALTALARFDDDGDIQQRLLEHSMASRAVELAARHPQLRIRRWALQVLSAWCASLDMVQTLAIIHLGALYVLRDVLASPPPAPGSPDFSIHQRMRMEAAFSLANIMTGDQCTPIIQDVMDCDAAPVLVAALNNDHYTVRRECVIAVANAIRNGSPAQVGYWLNLGICTPLVAALLSEHMPTILTALQALSFLLDMGKALTAAGLVPASASGSASSSSGAAAGSSFATAASARSAASASSSGLAAAFGGGAATASDAPNDMAELLESAGLVDNIELLLAREATAAAAAFAAGAGTEFSSDRHRVLINTQAEAILKTYYPSRSGAFTADEEGDAEPDVGPIASRMAASLRAMDKSFHPAMVSGGGHNAFASPAGAPDGGMWGAAGSAAAAFAADMADDGADAAGSGAAYDCDSPLRPAVTSSGHFVFGASPQVPTGPLVFGSPPAGGAAFGTPRAFGAAASAAPVAAGAGLFGAGRALGNVTSGAPQVDLGFKFGFTP